MHQSHKAYWQKSSVQGQIFKKPRSSESQVSKFFQNKGHSELNENKSLDIESPYKNTIKSLPLSKSNSLSDDDDFQQPNKNSLKWALSKVSKCQSSSKQKGKKKNKRIPNTTLKIVEDNFKYQEEHGDHLQMAIALSKSTHEEENKSGRSQNEMPDVSEIFSKQNAKMSVLEKYGFSSNHKSHLSVTNRKQNLDVQFKGKSRFKYITPILKIRTNEERQNLIATKISMILTENISQTIKPFHIYNSVPYTFDQSCTSKKHNIFNFDSDDARDFYVKDLQLLVSNSKCGNLLKNWQNIPGRAISPTRDIKTDIISDSKEINQVSDKQESTITRDENTEVISPVRSVSPDLFGSDNETDDLINYSTVRSLKNSMKTNKSTSLSTENDMNQTFSDNTEIELLENDGKINENIVNLTNEGIDISVKNKKRDPKLYSLSDLESDEEDNILSEKLITTDNEELMKLSFSKLTQSPIQSNMAKFSDHHDQANNYCNNCHSKNDSEKIGTLNCNKTNDYYSDCHNKSNLEEIKTSNSSTNIMKRKSDVIILSDDEQQPEINPDTQKSQKKISESIRQSMKYNDSSELNVTNYVDQLLNQEYLSFNQSHRKGHNTNDSKELDFPLNEQTDISSINHYDENVPDEDCYEKDDINNELDMNMSQTNSSSTIILSDQENCDDMSDNEQHVDEQNDDLGFNIQNTPKKFSRKMSRTLISERSKLYDSRELNVTDYVADLLANEMNYSLSYDGQNNSENENDDLSESQKSAISDEELNYSSHFSKVETENVSVEKYNEIKCIPSSTRASSINLEDIAKNVGPITPNRLIVKIGNVSPMRNYDEMSTPSLHKELAKYGIKPLKRSRGTKLLKHIYESTHPIIKEQIVSEYSDLGEDGKILKKRKLVVNEVNPYNECYKSDQTIEIIGDSIIENEKLENFIFERKQSAKTASCAVPLQIVWHNFVTSNPEIREHILLYEPLQLESLHLMLKEQGFKFHIQDLLTFLDKKCITIRTAQSQKRKNKK
ncbi:mutagen-sensitive 312 [Rhynchophorus ferrugineus]|uniref:mutagen-sensitive 312 n=1 Tax=Rhynchophorus ferrugineus TaxID=354439 RepID=UPI003FCD1BEC